MKTLEHTVNNSVVCSAIILLFDISTACLILFNNIAKREPINHSENRKIKAEKA